MRAFRGMLLLYQTELHILTNNPMDVITNVPEWVVTMQRNRWTVSSGMSGHYAAEYAHNV